MEEEKRSAASSRRRGLPPTEYWQRQRISMRRGYYSTFCRIWQGVGGAPKGGGILPSPRPPCLPPWGRCPRRGRMRVGLVGAVCSRKSLSSVTASPRHLPPRVGKAKENPPAGDGSPRRCAPRNDGELGIDFFPYHVILKIKRGAAGRREPPQRLQSSNRLAGWAWAVTSFYCCKYGRTESERSR